MVKVSIVGAGMSGLAAAITAAEAGCSVTVLERQEKPGKKIAITGNGKCNLSNISISAGDYVTDDETCLNEILSSFRRVEGRFWADLGLLLKEKRGGIYPASNQASTVVELLLRACRKYQVRIITNAKCTAVRKEDGRFVLDYVMDGKGEVIRLEADACILSCGGLAGIYQELSHNGYAISKALGLEHTHCYPALVQAKCRGGLEQLAGIRQDARVTLYIEEKMISAETGELQLTSQGLSGIAVFQLTRFMGEALRNRKKVEIRVDFFPQLSEESLAAFLKARAEADPENPVCMVLQGILQKPLNEAILEDCSLQKDLCAGRLTKENCLQLAHTYKNKIFSVRELNTFKNAQVSTGGVNLSECEKTLMVRKIPNLYITGEMLNVTGKCGGYNLYFATASGYLAAENIKQKLLRNEEQNDCIK